MYQMLQEVPVASQKTACSDSSGLRCFCFDIRIIISCIVTFVQQMHPYSRIITFFTGICPTLLNNIDTLPFLNAIMIRK